MEKKKKPSEIRFEKEAKALLIDQGYKVSDEVDYELSDKYEKGPRKTEKQGREDQWTRLRLRAADS